MRATSGANGSGRKLTDQFGCNKSNRKSHWYGTHPNWTYELLAFRNLSGQLKPPQHDLHFLRYRVEGRDGQRDVSKHRYFYIPGAASLGGFDLCGIWDFLYERFAWLRRILKDWLLRAIITALRSGAVELTRQVLEKTALSASQCEKILARPRR